MATGLNIAPLAGRQISLHSLGVGIIPGILIHHSQTALLIFLLHEVSLLRTLLLAVSDQKKGKFNFYIGRTRLLSFLLKKDSVLLNTSKIMGFSFFYDFLYH